MIKRNSIYILILLLAPIFFICSCTNEDPISLPEVGLMKKELSIKGFFGTDLSENLNSISLQPGENDYYLSNSIEEKENALVAAAHIKQFNCQTQCPNFSILVEIWNNEVGDKMNDYLTTGRYLFDPSIDAESSYAIDLSSNLDNNETIRFSNWIFGDGSSLGTQDVSTYFLPTQGNDYSIELRAIVIEKTQPISLKRTFDISKQIDCELALSASPLGTDSVTLRLETEIPGIVSWTRNEMEQIFIGKEVSFALDDKFAMLIEGGECFVEYENFATLDETGTKLAYDFDFDYTSESLGHTSPLSKVRFTFFDSDGVAYSSENEFSSKDVFLLNKIEPYLTNPESNLKTNKIDFRIENLTLTNAENEKIFFQEVEGVIAIPYH